jgi:hypothetical protein
LLHEVVARDELAARVMRGHVRDVPIVVWRPNDRAQHSKRTTDPIAQRGRRPGAGRVGDLA